MSIYMWDTGTVTSIHALSVISLLLIQLLLSVSSISEYIVYSSCYGFNDYTSRLVISRFTVSRIGTEM